MFCESLPQNTQSDYHRLRDALKDRFDNVYPRTVAWAMFSQLKQLEGESYEQFAARVRELARQAEPPDGPGPSVYMQVCLYASKNFSAGATIVRQLYKPFKGSIIVWSRL